MAARVLVMSKYRVLASALRAAFEYNRNTVTGMSSISVSVNPPMRATRRISSTNSVPRSWVCFPLFLAALAAAACLIFSRAAAL